MQSVALVRCDAVEHVVEDGDQCTVLCGRLVIPVNTADRNSDESEYRAIEWVNQPKEELPKLPRAGATVCLVPHPHGVTPTLIVGDCKVLFGSGVERRTPHQTPNRLPSPLVEIT